LKFVFSYDGSFLSISQMNSYFEYHIPWSVIRISDNKKIASLIGQKRSVIPVKYDLIGRAGLA